MLALDEQTHAARHIGSHIERSGQRGGRIWPGRAQLSTNRQRFMGVVHRLDGEVAHF